MSTASQLLSAVREHPDEDTPRLVYADFLDENDRPERAEFIRAQCEYARLPAWDARRGVLRHRMRVLLARRGREWYAELPELPGVTWGGFERGFVSSVSVSGANTLAAAASAIAAAAPVDSVEFTSAEFRPAGPVRLPWVRKLSLGERDEFDPAALDALLDSGVAENLRVLDLSGVGAENAGAAAIARATHLTQLEELDLSDCFVGVEGVTDLVGAKHLATLRVLKFSSYGSGYVEDPFLHSPGVMLLASGDSQLRNLTTLEIGQNQLDDAAVRALLTSPTLANLESVSLRYCDMPRIAFDVPAGPARWKWLQICGYRPSIGTLQNMATLPQLESLVCLDAEGCDLDAEDLSVLARARFAPTLTQLGLSRNGFGSTGAAALTVTAWPNLHTLDLTGNRIGEAGARALAAGDFPALTTLWLDSNELGDAGAAALASAKWGGSLRRLLLATNKIGPSGGAALLASGRFENVSELDLADNAIGENSAKAFALSAWPRLTDLGLNQARIGDAGVEALVASGVLANLLSLKLDGNDLTAAGVRALAAAETPRLRELWLASNKRLGGGGLTALADPARFPALLALWLSYCDLDAAALDEFARAPIVNQLRRLQIYGNKASRDSHAAFKGLHWGKLGPDWLEEEPGRARVW